MKQIIGSVSHGTLRSQDLLSVFLVTLRELGDTKTVDRINAEIPPKAFKDKNDEWWSTGEAEEIINGLFDALDNFAPPFFYFGTHEGDGSDFGFWFSPDAFEQACLAGEVFKVNGEWPASLPACEYVAKISDHGNVTLYDKKRNEIWAIV